MKLEREGEISLTLSKARSFILLIVMMLLISGCSKNDLQNTKHNLSIYLVKDLSTKEAMSKNINELPLENEPVLTDKEIKMFNWKTQTFSIKAGFSLEQRLEGKVPLDGKPFVLVVDGKRIYLGSFWTLISSLYYPDIPTIDSVWYGEINKNTYAIRYGLERQDPRSDKRIYEALKILNKLD